MIKSSIDDEDIDWLIDKDTMEDIKQYIFNETPAMMALITHSPPPELAPIGRLFACVCSWFIIRLFIYLNRDRRVGQLNRHLWDDDIAESVGRGIGICWIG